MKTSEYYLIREITKNINCDLTFFYKTIEKAPQHIQDSLLSYLDNHIDFLELVNVTTMFIGFDNKLKQYKLCLLVDNKYSVHPLGF